MGQRSATNNMEKVSVIKVKSQLHKIQRRKGPVLSDIRGQLHTAICYKVKERASIIRYQRSATYSYMLHRKGKGQYYQISEVSYIQLYAV